MANRNPVPSEELIPEVRAGGRVTLLSAWLANRLIRSVNSLLRLRVGPGLKITKADGNVLIELEKTEDESSTKNTGGGAGSGGDFYEFKLCRNGEQILPRINSLDDPATMDAEA